MPTCLRACAHCFILQVAAFSVLFSFAHGSQLNGPFHKHRAGPWKRRATNHPSEIAKKRLHHPPRGPRAESGSSSSPGSPAVVHFLFLVNQSIHHVDVWKAFFLGAKPGSYRVWVHCLDSSACRRDAMFKQLPWVQQVPTVPTSYCTDLVSATVQLLKSALASRAAQPGAMEKFALLSESSLPVKPFSTIHETLTASNDSDICIAPTSEWRGAHVEGVKHYLVKHSQWFVLNREHAELLVTRWVPAHPWDTFLGWWNIPLEDRLSRVGTSFGSPTTFLTRSSIAHVGASRFMRDNGQAYACTDEQAIFATIFGTFKPDVDGSKTLAGLGTITKAEPTSLNVQGRCRTFVVFRNTKDLGNLTDPIMDIINEDNSSTTFIDPDASHPLMLECAGQRTLAALRASPFLFARKFGELADSTEAQDDVGVGRSACDDRESYMSLIGNRLDMATGVSASVTASPAHSFTTWGHGIDESS
eukprot:TRINITY_DN63762_c0_g1_i1.p1 TRINITY_DN63762_c0_g1~~TRINITY_DN63762_c0_g1_i1.p1  ORF type:complete len:490 (-),score=33.70 TRINITY_DN63762_c0_g1_i1:29-1447(-)